MTTTVENLLRAGTVDEVRERGCVVVTGGGHTIAVFSRGDDFAAVDNRCPHMGFPLDRGTVSNGILTCHWHHARFDLASGGTFDPFADDVRAFPVTVSDGQVWVDPNPPEPDPVERWSHRLQDGYGAHHSACDSKVRARTQLRRRRLPRPSNDWRGVRHHLLRPRLGTGAEHDDLLREHPQVPLP